MRSTHECIECGELTVVQTWHATLEEPADSTIGDGCEHCGGELDPEPVDDLDPDAERDWDMERSA